MRTRSAFVGRVGGARRRRPAGAFTLVEIVAAMALSVIIMLGMVQVFKMASEAVTNTEAVTDSHQMARGILSLMQQDLMCFSNDGYLYILPQRIANPHISDDNIKYWYNFDTLIFTAVGRFKEMGTGSANPQESSSAEIMYSYARRDNPDAPDSSLPGAPSDQGPNPWDGTPFNNKDPRGVCLIRKAFLGAGQMSGGSILPGGPVTGPRSCFIMMQQENKWKSTPSYRISPMRITGNSGYGNMAQIVDASEESGFDSNVNYIIGDRVSEFMVEIWAYGNGELGWQRPWPAGEPGKTDGSPHYLWAGTRRNPEGEVTCRYPPATTDVTHHHYTMPRMIRVTLVVHPHNDQAPLGDQGYGGKKYRGDVFRQVFRLSGVRGGRMKIPPTTTP